MTEVADLAPAAPSKGLFECLSCCSPAPVKEEEPAPVEEPPKEGEKTEEICVSCVQAQRWWKWFDDGKVDIEKV